jgi:hypothetical protein
MITKFALSFAISLSLLGAPASSSMRRPDTIEPKMMGVPQLAVSKGATCNLVVSLSDVVSTNTTVNLSEGDPSRFSDIPSSVTIYAGTSSNTFQATVDAHAPSGYVSVTGTANGGQATGYVQIS